VRSVKGDNSLPHSLTILKNDEAKHKAALGKYLYTYSFDSVDEFLCVKIIIDTVFFCKMFVIFYIVNLYTRIFTT
jgi:hypothetical protein